MQIPDLSVMADLMTTSLLDGKTLAGVFVKRAVVSSDQRAYLVKKNGAYQPLTWKEVHTVSLGVYEGLKKAAVGKADRVAILSNSRPEWSICDIAIQTLGAVTVPIYQSNTPEEVAFILEHSGARFVFAEDASQAAKLQTIFTQTGKTLPVVTFQPGVQTAFACESFETFSKIRGDAAELAQDQKRSADAVKPDDLATIVYTSGTTGTPKGARLLHSCLIAEIRGIAQEVSLSTDDTLLSFLPFAHVLGRIESLVPLMTGVTLAYAESVNSITSNIKEVKPTLLISVPRIYEKIYSKIQSEIDSSSTFKKGLFEWSVKVGRDVARLRSAKQPIPVALMLKFRVADQLVFSKVREKMGGRLRFTVSGGAPLSPDLCLFFHACGIKILEGYGLTETMGAIAVNRPDDYRFATVGRPLAGTHFRIAQDGEIQVKGPAVFAGYFNDEKSTREALTEDGWFCTGDIGEFDEKGFLKITDRKKELIVTSGGKNIAPQKLENLIKSIPLVSQAYVAGDRQKYLVALVTLSEAEAKRWAKERDIAFESVEELATKAELISHLEKGFKQINKELASYETVKRFKTLPRDFSLEAGEMTASLKLKRKVIAERYKSEVESLYH